MSMAGAITHPFEDIRSETAARTLLTRLRAQIWQARRVGWPEYQASFERDEQRLLALMRERGWTPKEGR